MIRASLAVCLLAAGMLMFVSPPTPAEANDELTALAKALPEATISIMEGLKLSEAEAEGKPISAEYEIEGGALLLSVYILKDNQFDEVTINARSGSLEQVKPLTDSNELTDAQTQSAALAKAKVTLDVALSNAMSKNSDYRAVSIIPMLDGEQPVAAITLLKGTDLRRVAEKLD